MPYQNLLRKDNKAINVIVAHAVDGIKDVLDDALMHCINDIEWEQTYNEWPNSGRIKVPRLVKLMGAGEYSYSGVELKPIPWTPQIEFLNNMYSQELGLMPFNTVLLNYYRNARDSVGFHSDDEPELGVDPTILSVSLGATRTFQLRRKDASREIISVDLHHGSTLVMYGNCQRTWCHSIPKSMSSVGPRINLTFRNIVR